MKSSFALVISLYTNPLYFTTAPTLHIRNKMLHYLFFLLWLLFFAGLWIREKAPGKAVTVLSLLAVLLCGAVFLGMERLALLPALILREGLSANRLPVNALNAFLGCFLAGGGIFILKGKKR